MEAERKREGPDGRCHRRPQHLQQNETSILLKHILSAVKLFCYQAMSNVPHLAFSYADLSSAIEPLAFLACVDWSAVVSALGVIQQLTNQQNLSVSHHSSYKLFVTQPVSPFTSILLSGDSPRSEM